VSNPTNPMARFSTQPTSRSPWYRRKRPSPYSKMLKDMICVI